MLSPAGRQLPEESERRQRADEIFSNMEVARFEPQQLMEFLEFCAGKIHAEQTSTIQ